MYMKDFPNNSISDDAEFDDLEDFDYVEQFGSQEDYDEDSSIYDEDYDDLEDLYVEDEEEYYMDEEDIDELESLDEADYLEDEDVEVNDGELEYTLVCEECGHKWKEYVSETEEENDLFDAVCPLCGSTDVVIER